MIWYGSLVSISKITFRSHGRARYAAEPLKFFAGFWCGVSMFSNSLTVLQLLRISKEGVTILQSARAVSRLRMTGVAQGPRPTRHATLFKGQFRLPPKFFGL